MSSSGRRLKSFAKSPMILPLRSRRKCSPISPGPGVGDNDQVFYAPVQAELVQERGCCCREVVLDEPLAIGVGRAGVMTRTRA